MKTICLSLLLLLLPIISLADQNDPRLGDLFLRLKSAPNATAAFPIEQRIWEVWMAHDMAIDRSPERFAEMRQQPVFRDGVIPDVFRLRDVNNPPPIYRCIAGLLREAVTGSSDEALKVKEDT
jgi:hypothetical protein